MTVIIRSFLFYLLLIIWTLLWGGGGRFVIFFAKDKKKATIRITKTWAKFICKLLHIVCRITVDVRSKLPENGPIIIAAKHESAWETIFFLQYFKAPVYVVKSELLKIPIYGWYIKTTGMIAINRKSKYATQIMLDGVGKAIAANKVIIIFPEGTRTRIGLPTKCKKGIFAIQQRYPNVPIIPVALNSGVCWKKHLKIPGRIQVVTKERIPSGLEQDKMLDLLAERITFGAEGGN